MSLKGNAFATRKSYVRGVKALICHLQKLPEECTVQEIHAFLVEQRDKKGYSSSTVNLRVCGLKFYFREVVHRLDLVVKIPNPRVQKYDTEVLNLEEVGRLRSACRDMRQLLIINLLYETGIRVREAVRLRVSDFDKHHRSISVRNSKGRKTRVLYYGRFCLHILPKGFRKIRQFGFLSNATKAKSIEKARQSLGQRHTKLLNRKERKALAVLRVFGSKEHQCTACKTGKMLVVEQWQRNKSPPVWVANFIQNT